MTRRLEAWAWSASALLMATLCGWGAWAWGSAPGHAGAWEVTGRWPTGHQRAEHTAFSGDGKALAVTCPRYNRLVLFAIGDGPEPEGRRDVELDGRPMALAWRPDSAGWIVLVEPPGDRKHLEPGWLETRDRDGLRVGDRVPVGYYPDDLAVDVSSRRVLTICSGSAEGGVKHDPPMVACWAYDGTACGSWALAARGDGPRHLAARGGRFAVTTADGVALGRIDAPEIESIELPDARAVAFGASENECRAVDDRGDVWKIDGGRATPHPLDEAVTSGIELPDGEWAYCLKEDSALLFEDAGRLDLRGAWGMTRIRPGGLALDPRGRTMAVTNWAGGGIYRLSVLPPPAHPPGGTLR